MSGCRAPSYRDVTAENMDILNWVFFGPAKLIQLWPYAGVVIAALLIILQIALTLRARKSFDTGFFRQATVFAGLLWLIFNAFELQLAAVTLKNGGTTLRLDLVVLVPILYVLTLAAVISVGRQLTFLSAEKPQNRDH